MHGRVGIEQPIRSDERSISKSSPAEQPELVWIPRRLSVERWANREEWGHIWPVRRAHLLQDAEFGNQFPPDLARSAAFTKRSAGGIGL